MLRPWVKLLRKLVPHSLAIKKKLSRKQISQHNFNKNKTDFERHHVTMNGTKIYHHDPKLKQQQLQAEAEVQLQNS